jgi:hypothetical protein
MVRLNGKWASKTCSQQGCGKAADHFIVDRQYTRQPHSWAVLLRAPFRQFLGLASPKRPHPGINARASRKEPPEGDSAVGFTRLFLPSPGIYARAGARTLKTRYELRGRRTGEPPCLIDSCAFVAMSCWILDIESLLYNPTNELC